MPEPSGDDFGRLTSSEPMVFVCDESPEGERVQAVLRARGYSVSGVALGRLLDTVRTRHPALVICDVESEAGLSALRELGETHFHPRIHLIAVGERSRTMAAHADELRRITVSTFERPIDTYALLRRVEGLLGPPRPVPGTSVEPPSPWSSLPDSSVPPSASPSARTGAWVRGPLPPSRPPIQSSRESGIPGRSVPQAELSPELEDVLKRAEQRLGSGGPGFPSVRPGRMSPQEELETFLPADILAALDEPLDLDDDIDSGSLSQVSDPSRSGMGSASEQGSAGSVAGTGANTPGTPVHGKGIGTAPGNGETTGPTPADDSPELDRPKAGGAPLAPGANGRFVAMPQNPSTFPPAGPPITEHIDATPTARPGADTIRRPLAGVSAAPRPQPAAGYDAPAEPLVGPHPPPFSAEPQPGSERPSATPTPPVSTRPPRRRGDVRVEPAERVALVSPPPEPPQLPPTLRPGDAIHALAQLVRSRYTGAVAFEDPAGIHRIVLRDGDFVTAATGVERESLAAFLLQRGALSSEAAERLGRRIPQFGRHAGAALIAHGQLRQDELWPVLRAHAEWLIGHTLLLPAGAVSLESEVPARLKAEPPVFGGATGAEVLVEIVRRVVPPEVASERLGSQDVKLLEGRFATLLGECGLPEQELAQVERGRGSSLGTLLGETQTPDFAAVLYALVELGVLDRVLPDARPTPRPVRHPVFDELDEQAQRARIVARRALVDEGDYFAVLGVARSATAYDIRRAYLELKREFEPARALTASTADLRDDLDTILEVVDEAYEILRDQTRRDRYRRALEAAPG